MLVGGEVHHGAEDHHFRAYCAVLRGFGLLGLFLRRVRWRCFAVLRLSTMAFRQSLDLLAVLLAPEGIAVPFVLTDQRDLVVSHIRDQVKPDVGIDYFPTVERYLPR